MNSGHNKSVFHSVVLRHYEREEISGSCEFHKNSNRSRLQHLKVTSAKAVIIKGDKDTPFVCRNFSAIA